ncbi:hypothetical protein [Dongshaea marina]|uniref:hypothetical protein n=1 Tax=Dongshaea marina TaxID=2047966 RepID=UPI000D3E4722|nr:hypothetical protein [Dongshaea marina]
MKLKIYLVNYVLALFFVSTSVLADSYGDLFTCGHSWKSVWARVDLKNKEQHQYILNFKPEPNPISTYTYQRIDGGLYEESMNVDVDFQPGSKFVTIKHPNLGVERKYVLDEYTNRLIDTSGDGFSFVFSHCIVE